MSSREVGRSRSLPRDLRSALVVAIVGVLSLWMLARDPLPFFDAAVKAIPAIAAGGPVEQVGERGELNELIAAVSRSGRGPVLFLAPNGREHRFRAFFAAYALFPRRLVYAVPEPSRPQFDWWTPCDMTAEAINRLAKETGAESAIFWKTPVPSGFASGREVLELPDQRWVVFLR